MPELQAYYSVELQSDSQGWREIEVFTDEKDAVVFWRQQNAEFPVRITRYLAPVPE